MSTNQIPKKIRTVAIIGGGPAGSSLAAYLARAGLRVVFFTRPKRPPIIVGESLVPGVIPFLKKLGVEEEAKSYGYYKSGATFIFDGETRLSFDFGEVPGAVCSYAYNVPRDRLDRSIYEAALREGAIEVEMSARLARVEGTQRVELVGEAAEAAREALGGDPDWIVDAGGRNRQLARLMDLEAIEGPRKDAALHAHFSGIPVEVKGHIHSDRLDHGWCWRIPLPERVSIGVVINREILKKHGDSPEEQLDNLLRADSVTRRWMGNAERLTPVVSYNNYQLRTPSGIGPNWALLGDAYGFIDPVFSSGMLIGMQASDALAKAILQGGERAFQRYDAFVQRNLTAWQQIVDYYYSGELLTMFKVGLYMRERPLGRILDLHLRNHMPRIFTGEKTTGRYNLWLVNFLCKHGLAGNDPLDFEVR